MPARPHSATVVSIFERSRPAPSDAPGVARFQLAYVPIADLKRGVSCGFQVVVGADEQELDERREWASPALEAEAVAFALGRLAEPPPNCFLLVPVSPLALIRDEVQQALGELPRLDGIAIEITEGAGSVSSEDLRAALARSRARGATLAISDTDSGYGCLRQIVDLRPQFVKIGGTFTSEVDRDEAKAAVVEMVGTLAGRMDAWLIAEGVSRREELDALIHLRVPLAQGPACGPARPRMRGIDPETARHINRRASAREDGAGIVSLLERRPTLEEGAAPDELAAAFLADARFDYVVLTDSAQRPVGLAERAAFLRREPHLTEPMLVSAGDTVRDVAWRAMTRPKSARFDPAVCCDVQGRFVGIVRMERLFESMPG